jgi:hypothetical protein
MVSTSSAIPPKIIVSSANPTFLGSALQLFNEDGTRFWILTGAIVAFVVLRYVKAMQEVS